MQLQAQPTFLKALAEIMKDGVAAVALSRADVFFLANTLCPKDQQVRLGTYLRFVDSLNEYGEPTETTDQTELLLDIHDYLEAQEAKQRLKLLQAINEGQKDWRRFVWLLQFRQKEERLKLAQAKQAERERKEKLKATETAAKQGMPQSAPSNLAPPQADHNAITYRKAG